MPHFIWNNCNCMNVILVNRKCFSNLLWASGSCYIMSKRGIFVYFSRNMAWLFQKWRAWICLLLNVSYILAIFTHILGDKRIILCCFCIRKIKYHVICKICFFLFLTDFILGPQYMICQKIAIPLSKSTWNTPWW